MKNRIIRLFGAIDIPIASSILCEIILILGLACDLLFESNAGDAAYFAMLILMLIMFLILILMTLSAAFQIQRHRPHGNEHDDSCNKDNFPDQTMPAESNGDRILIIVWIAIIATMVIRIVLKFT